MRDFEELPAHLRAWGLDVEVADGWRHRGRPYKFIPFAIFCHHTASGADSGNWASNNIVTFGRAGIPGPLSQILLGRDGRVRVISVGYANHAGLGGPIAGIPKNMGNTYGWGIEAENNGVGERWNEKQLNAYYRLCAALLDFMGSKDVSKIIGHKEWTRRKIDPAGIDMNGFRKRVKEALDHGPSVVTVSLSKLKPGKRNQDVLRVKRRLDRRGFSGPRQDTYFGLGLQNAYQNFQRSLGYEGEDADGIPGKTSLEKLGFRVVP